MALDLLIKNGLVVDGTGAEPYRGSVGVKDGRIVAVGDVKESAAKVLDVDGLAVAPGFWDVHTHYDAQLLWDPIATSSSWHGVTTVVMGNCGLTIAPCKPQDQEYIAKMLSRVEGMDLDVLKRTLPWSWESYGEYIDALEPHLGINAAILAGHSTIRRYVMGPESAERTATDAEVDEMKRALHECMEAGAFGFSTGRVITHADGDGKPVGSRVADLSEIYALAGVLRDFERGYVQLAVGPDFNKYSDEGRQRLSELARVSQRTVCINSITQSRQDPSGWRDVLRWMHDLDQEGRTIIALGNVLPRRLQFNLKFTNFFDRYALWQKVLLPDGKEKMKLLGDPGVRSRLRREMEEFDDPFFRQNPLTWDRIALFRGATESSKRFEGKNLVEIGAALGKDPMDAMLDISLEENLETQFIQLTKQDEEVVSTIFRSPHFLLEQSDAGAHVVTEVNTGFPTHVLGYWVRERQVMSLQEAVWRLSGLPAHELGVTGRGEIREGQAADLVVFDPESVSAGEGVFANDLPGGHPRLVQHAKGIVYTMVNGQMTLDHGSYTGAEGGIVLRANTNGASAPA